MTDHQQTVNDVNLRQYCENNVNLDVRRLTTYTTPIPNVVRTPTTQGVENGSADILEGIAVE